MLVVAMVSICGCLAESNFQFLGVKGIGGTHYVCIYFYQNPALIIFLIFLFQMSQKIIAGHRFSNRSFMHD